MSMTNVPKVISTRARVDPAVGKIVLHSPATPAQFDGALRPLLRSDRSETPILIDLRALSPAPDTATIRELALRLQRFAGLGLGRVAIVGSPDYLFGIARMLAAYAELAGVSVSAFRTDFAAHGWLSESPPEPPSPCAS